MRTFLPLALALTGVASAQQFTLPVNPTPNNGGSPGWAIFSDFSAACDTVVSHMTTASTAAAGAAFTVEVFVRTGTGLGGPVAAGPGSSPAGWASLGVANATQGATANGVSLPIDIPDIFVPRGSTVGVAFLFGVAGPRYFGTGTPPYGVFTDGNLTVTTGDSRTAPFTTGGNFFTSRGHVGQFLGRRLGCDLAMTDCLPGTFVDISGTGTALNLTDDASVDIATTVSNAVFAAGTARVGSNGCVGFNGAAGQALAFTNTGLPAGGVFTGNQALCAFWDDVNTGGGVNGNIYWQEIGGTLYVQWNDVAFFGGLLTERATFQVQVPSSGPAYAQFLYTDIEGTRPNGGESATIGYQGGATASNDIQYAFNAADALRNGSVISLVEADAVVFTPDIPGTWIDIAGTGTALNLADDDAVDIVTTVGNALLGAGTVRVGSNGAVRFAGVNNTLGFTNQPIPSLNAFNGDQTLMAFWDDINTLSGAAGNIYWQEVGNTLVVQWENARFFASSDTATFQIQVPNSGPVFAQFLYEDVTSARAARGASATIGYQAGGIANDGPWSFDTASVDNGTVLSLVQARRKVGASYCTANPNSTGVPGQIVLSGSASSAANDLRLNAQHLPTNAFGYFIASTTSFFVPNAGGSQGNLCLGGNIGRAVGGAVLFSGGSGSFTILANLNAIPQPGGGPVAALPGETWHFQGWHRDSVGGVATSNLTNAVQVQILP